MDKIINYEPEKTPIGTHNVAFVLKTNEELTSGAGSIGAYIPKFMSEIDMKDGPWEQTITPSSSMVKNVNIPITFEPVELRNYYTLKPYRMSNMEQPPLSKGERFYATCIEGDIKNIGYTPMFSEETKREFDRVKLHAGDGGDGKGQYHFTMDTKDQLIKMESGTGKGEKDSYSFTINGKEGQVNLNDSRGQKFQIDTEKKRIAVQNESGTYIECVGNTVTIYGPASVVVNAPSITLNGNTTINGNVKVAGSINASGSIIDAGGNTNHHSH